MSTLKNYSKLSKVTYKSIRTFVSSNQNKNAFRPEISTNPTIGTNNPSYRNPNTQTQNPNYANSATSNQANSPFAVAQAVAETGANLAASAIRGLTDTASNIASGQSQTRQAYDPNNTGTSNKNVEHFTSTDTRFNAFSTTGHVSGFGAPWKRDFAASDNFSSSAKRFADTTASNIKGAVNQGPNELLGQALGQTFYAVGSAINSFVNIATSVGNTLAPKGQGRQGQAQTRSNYSPRDQNYVNYGERRPEHYTSTETRFNFFNPGQASGSAERENPIGSFVNSVTQGVASNVANAAFQGAVNTAANIAGTYVPGSQQAIRGAANAAQGFVNTAATLASSFIPGSQTTQSNRSTRDNNVQNQNQNQNQNNDFMYRGSQVDDIAFTEKQGKAPQSRSEEMADQAREYVTTAGAVAKDVADMAASGISDFTRKTSKAAGKAANSFVTSAGSAALSAASSAVKSINTAATAPEGVSDLNSSFMYTGTQLNEDLFNENKKTARKLDHPLYDIVISGGGPAGAALACALGHYRYFSKEDQKIVILDPQEPPSLEKFSDKNRLPEHRVVSLSMASVQFLKEMGVWSLLNRERIGSIHQMQVWEAGGNSFIKFNENPTNEIGYVVETAHLQAAIFERIRALGNVKIESPNKITDLRNEGNDFATVILGDEEKVAARLVVGSDGQNSLVKKKSKIGSIGWSSLQHGIVCTVKTNFRNTTAWQRFLSTGPLAVLPLWDEYSSIVWSCESDLYTYLMQANDEDFLKELNYNLTRRPLYNTPNLVFSSKATFDLPPPITEVCNKRLSFPLSMGQANQFVAPRVALVGDAAHNIHPLAGQGLNLGLTDAAYLANVIVKNLKSGNDIGSQDHLREYEGQSMSLNSTMMYGLEFIKRFYEANDNGVSVNLRNLATSTINNFGPMKSWFIDAANGKYSQPSDYEWKKI